MKKLIVIGLAISLAGCSNFQTGLTKLNTFANTYGPIVGKDIIMVSNILVQAECSPALGVSTATATKILTITAPNSSSAITVVNALNANYAVAQQLCPLIAAIKAQVGTVPNSTPSQVIN